MYPTNILCTRFFINAIRQGERKHFLGSCAIAKYSPTS